MEKEVTENVETTQAQETPEVQEAPGVKEAPQVEAAYEFNGLGIGEEKRVVPQEQEIETEKSENDESEIRQEDSTDNASEKEERPGEEHSVQAEQEDLLGVFKDKGYEYENVDSLIEDFEQLKGYKEKYSEEDIGNLKSKLEQIEKENLQLREEYDPVKIFGSEDKYKKHLIKKTLVDSGKSEHIVDRLLNADLDSIDDIKLLGIDQQLKSSHFEGKDARAEAVALSLLGIEPEEQDELTEIQKDKIHSKAAEVRAQIKGIINDVKVPESVNTEEQRKELQDKAQEALEKKQNDLKPLAKQMANDFEELVFSEDKEELFKFKFDDKFKQDIPRMVEDYIIANDLPLNKDSFNKAGNYVQNVYLLSNINKIIKAVRTDASSEVHEKIEKEVVNSQPLSEQQSPTRGEEDSGKSQARELLNSWMGNPSESIDL